MQLPQGARTVTRYYEIQAFGQPAGGASAVELFVLLKCSVLRSSLWLFGNVNNNEKENGKETKSKRQAKGPKTTRRKEKKHPELVGGVVMVMV